MSNIQTSGSSASQIGPNKDPIEQKKEEILGKTSIKQWEKKGENLYNEVNGNMSQRVLHNMEAKVGEVLGKKDPLSQRIWQAIQTFFSKLSAQIRLDDTKSADFALLDELMDAIEKQDVDGFKAVFDIFETRYPGTKEQLKNHVKFLLGDVTQSETSSVATALRELLEISKGET